MNKKIILLVSLILLILLITIITTNTNKHETITIGVLTPLTGDISSWGQAIKKGINLANKEANYKIKLIFEDTKCDTKEALTATNKLIEINNVTAILGTVCSSVTLTTATITEKNQTILFSIGSSSPEITHAGDYVFRIWPSDDYEVSVMSNYISKNKKDIKNISILYLENDYGTTMKEQIVKQFTEKGIEVKSIEKFNSNSKDVRSQLTKIKLQNPDSIYFVGYPDDTKFVFKQISELNIDSCLIVPGWIMEDKSISEYITYINKVIYTIPNIKPTTNFKNKLVEEYGEEGDYALVSALAYDSYNIFKEITDKCADNTECIKEEMYKVNYNGVSGDISFDSYGDIVDRPYKIKYLEDGKVIELN